MNILEITIFAITFFSLLAGFNSRFQKGYLRLGLTLLAIVISFGNLLLTGYRWQMVPVYGLLFIILILELIKQKNKTEIKNKLLRVGTGVLAFLILTVCLILPLLLPVVDLPAPHGPYAVGITHMRLSDVEREEIFSEDSNDVRSVLVTAWYPAEVEEGTKPITYWDNDRITGKAYSVNADMGTFWYSHLSNVKTNSFANALISTGEISYPVLVYSHSFVGLNTENTMLFEELASQGYIVLSVAHPYEAIISLYPDGKPIYGNYEYIADLYNSHYEIEEQLYQDFENSQVTAEKEKILEQIFVVDDVSTHMLEERTKDVVFVLNQLTEINQNAIFQSKMDVENIGIFGWSFGGATAMDVCIVDQRCKAGINIDGWPYGSYFASDTELKQPFMIINSGSDDETEQMVGMMVFKRSENDAYRVKIDGAEHTNFWDFPLFFDIYQYLGYWGPIDAERLLNIEETYTTWFFDKYLKGENVIEVEKISELYPEVEFMKQLTKP